MNCNRKAPEALECRECGQTFLLVGDEKIRLAEQNRAPIAYNKGVCPTHPRGQRGGQ